MNKLKIYYTIIIAIGLLLTSCSYTRLLLAKEDIRVTKSSPIDMWGELEMRRTRYDNCAFYQSFNSEKKWTISKDNFRVIHHGDAIPFDLSVWSGENIKDAYIIDSTSMVNLYFSIKPLVNGDSLQIVEYGIPSTGDSIVIDMSIIRHGDSAIDKRIIRDKTKD